MNLAHKIHFFVNRELSEVYVSYAIRAFAFSLIGLFIPIFLLILNYPLRDVLLFFFYIELLGIPFAFLAVKVIEKIGFKHSILLSMPVQIFFFFLMFALNKTPMPLWILAAVYSLAISLFWIPFHFEFAKNSDKKKRASEFGMLETLALLVVVFGPLAGAAIIANFSFSALFVIVSMLLFLSAFPLLLSQDKKMLFKVNYKKFFFEHKKAAKIFLSEGVMDYAQIVLWPIFIYLVLGEILSLGMIGALGGFFTAFVPAIIGRISDTFSRAKIMNIGASILAPASILRGFSFFSSFSWLSVWSAICGLGAAIFFIPFISTFYNEAARHKYERYIVFREIYLKIGRSILILIAILLLTKFEWRYAFIACFAISAIATFISSKYVEAKS